ncbi:ATP-dependent RNA helicase [Corynebacterium genitalium ATCC 33030]|uniref:RNA helicase n=1 Tax=Corynebacterium genitalium ATCC 33030 TaxID=585529 RepID=D7WBL6_9CORY|nr:ATP-dependent helicase C-terminal domain-containing protein [Corynebacterium genitalium]EFK55247.1 ATP-dependent helicase HrpB [Corynebacterium genitalium ATCC 33030]UUA89497.1 ATP-dependent RNA helicase [Corynebacterium genitalium ATCC 33030]
MFDLSVIGQGLPVAGVIGDLPAHGPLVVEAPPGTGKTTLVPPAISNKVEGLTLVTAPRRVAVRAAARRLSLLDGSPHRVGYSIRGEHRDGSLVEFVTPGVLLNRLLRDPELTGVGAVIIDEVHERQLDTDLVLAMAMEVAFLREDLYLAAMSATLDAAALAEHMGAQILSTEAVTHPLDVSYHPHPGRAEGSPEFYAHVADLAHGASERTLVFVPGVREVDQVCAHLPNGSAAPLHGRLSSKEQDDALNGDAPVVVATSIAESSITVPGVRRVVDAGLSRVPRRDAARGMTGLVTVSAAKTSADQRAGRAGRLGPGEVLRAYSESDYQHFSADIVPEIATSDLTSAALTLAAWGSPDLPLLTQPPAGALDAAHRTLEALGALEGGAITPFGEQLSRLPLDPRLGAALLEHGSGAAPTVAALAEGIGGDLAHAHARAPKNQVQHLAKMVPDSAPVPAGDVVASAYPEWVAKRLDEREYLLASGTRATLDSSIPPADWIVAAEVQLTHKGAIIRAAAATDFPAHRVTTETTATLEGGKVRGRRVRSIGAIELDSTPIQLTAEEAAEALKHLSFEQFPLDDKARRLKERLDFLHAQHGDPWPDVTKGDYSPETQQLAHGTPLDKLDMHAALTRQLPWPEAARMDELAPEKLAVPSGSHPRIDYSSGRPVVKVKLQECFGLGVSPSISNERVLFHLLSPAGRELAVTDDLESFWNGPYQDVRKEMRGRYPKHPWPEDPWTAPATARTKNRM